MKSPLVRRSRWPAILVFAAVLAALTPRVLGLQLWLYCSQNLWVDQNITNLETLMRRSAKAGYTHVLLSDSKFAKLGDMDAHYFNNVNHVKQVAKEVGLELVPALFPIGYSNDLLWHDPNLIEAIPVRDILLVVQGGSARVQSEVPVSFPGGNFSNLALWTWKDPTVTEDQGTARISNPQGQIARIVQQLKVLPFHQYHISVKVKTQAFQGTPEVKILAGNQSLNYNNLGVQQTQDWQTHHVMFNSLSNSQVSVYFGCWGGTTGTLWFDDARIEEVAFLNLVRRPGAPLVIRRDNGAVLQEGTDYSTLTDPQVGVRLWPGSYDIYHTPPVLPTHLPDGTRLRVSYYHAVTVYDDQAMICPSEQKTVTLLQDQAQRMHAAWGAHGYMMSHDEIRVLNWCAACQNRNLGAAAILADNVRTCINILRQVNPGGQIYVWSDMFDPNHNAHAHYYLVNGDLTGSWKGLDKDIIILPWYFEQRTASLKFFADLGNRQVIAGYYDTTPGQIGDWLETAKQFTGIRGVMYTTWQSRYTDLEAFAQVANRYQSRRGAISEPGGVQLEFDRGTGGTFTIQSSTNLSAWQTWTNADGWGTNTWPVDASVLPAHRFFRSAQ